MLDQEVSISDDLPEPRHRETILGMACESMEAAYPILNSMLAEARSQRPTGQARCSLVALVCLTSSFHRELNSYSLDIYGAVLLVKTDGVRLWYQPKRSVYPYYAPPSLRREKLIS